MSSIATTTVGKNAQPLAAGPVVGADAAVVTIINLDTANTVNLGSAATSMPLQLGPLASLTLTAPVWAGAVTVPLEVGIIPGGASYSPGSLTITGPVTATISGPVDATVSGAVDITAGNVDVTGVGGVFPPGGYASVISDTSTHVIAVDSSYTTPVEDVTNYLAYGLQVQVYCPSQGSSQAALTCPVTLSFYADSGGTILLHQEIWWMWVVNSAANAALVPLTGIGPLQAGYMSVTVGNPSGTVTLDLIAVHLYGTGRTVPVSQFRQQSPAGKITGGIMILPLVETVTPITGSDLILCNEVDNGSTAPSNVYWLPLPLYSGTFSARYQTNVALTNDFVLAGAQSLLNGDITPGAAANGCLWNPGNTPGTDYDTMQVVGRQPMYAVISTTSTFPIFSLVIQGAAS
jgi:hypothetical protein